MIKLKSLLKENKKQFIGNCMSIIDNSDVFSDATEMSNVIESSDPLSYASFISQVNPTSIPIEIKNKLKSMSFGSYKDLLWGYDDESDVHYFFM